MTQTEIINKTSIVRQKFSVKDFHKMMEVGILPEESGWEIIDGDIIRRMPIGSRHAGTLRRLEKLLERRFGEIVMISGQNPIHIDDSNEPEPDIALLKLRDDFYAESHPVPEDVLLLIEISDSTLEYDRVVKKTLYAESGIKEFWIVNLPENTVEIYSSPKNGNYRLAEIFESGEIIKSKMIKDLMLPVEEILG